MKHVLLALLLCSPLAPAPHAAEASSPAPRARAQEEGGETPAGPTEEERLEAFREKLRLAREIDDWDKMAELFTEEAGFAVDRIMELCEQLTEQSNEKLEIEMDAMGKAWKRAFKTGFVDKVYEYHSLLQLKTDIRRERKILKQRFEDVSKSYVRAREASNPSAFLDIGNEYSHLGEAFEEVGDRFMVAKCYGLAGVCADEILAGDSSDFEAAAAAYEKGLPVAEELGLAPIPFWVDSAKRLEALNGMGYGKAAAPEPAEPIAPTGGAEPGAPSTALRVPLQFELVEDVTALERPAYGNDELYPIWNVLGLLAVDSTTRFASMETSPEIIRTSASKAMVDTDGDGAGDVEIPIKGKIAPVSFEIGEGPSRRPWGFLVMTGDEKETYQGLETNMQPDDNQMQIFYAPAASMVGTVGETPIRVIDDNMDGVYGSPPVSYGYIGLTEDSFQPDMDSIVVGEDRTARPWSEMQEIGGSWYKLEPQAGGTELEATPVQVQTGTLALKVKGIKPSYVIVQGEGPLENSFFDLVAGGKKGVEVPVGRYVLLAGFVRKGKRQQMMKALILPGKRTPKWSVSAGKTTEVELGAPFGFDFTVSDGGDTVTVLGESVVITGVADERYERPWNCAPRPEVSIRPVGSKRGSKPEDMEYALDQDAITIKGWSAAWFPFDLTLEKKEPGEPVEVQLTEKKNELFGKIESVWKQ